VKLLAEYWLGGHEVQVRDNYRQSGHKKIWDTVLSNYGSDI